MKRQRDNFAAEDDSEVTLVGPRFDEEAKEAARPVVPLSQVRSADFYGRAMAGGPHAPARYGRNGWPRSLVIMLAVVAVAAAVTAAALYQSAKTPAPQASDETTVEAGAETADKERVPAAAEKASEPAPESSSATRERENVARGNGTAAPSQPAREAEPRVVAPAREETLIRVGDDERRARGEEKLTERARKEEKKQAKREEKEAERLADKQRGRDKREEIRPRLVGIYVEGRKH